MNWFSRERFKSAANLNDVDLCEHLESDPQQPTLVIVENDSFGIVGKIGRCEHCVSGAEKAEALETDWCMDCKTDKPKSEINYWKPYDYYPQQGDVPYVICNTCYALDRHKGRMHQDQENYEAEMGYDDD